MSAFSELAARMRADGRLDAIARVASKELKRVSSASVHVQIAGIVARECVAAGETARGEAWVALAMTASERRATTVPVTVFATRAELRFWQGRYELGTRELVDAPRHPLTDIWRGLLAWGAGDCIALEHAFASRGEPLPVDDERSRTWQTALQLLVAHAQGDDAAVASAWSARPRSSDSASRTRAECDALFERWAESWWAPPMNRRRVSFASPGKACSSRSIAGLPTWRNLARARTTADRYHGPGRIQALAAEEGRHACARQSFGVARHRARRR